MMLNNTERNLLVKTFKEMPDAEKVAKIYSVSSNSVYRLARQMRETGSVELRTSSRGRKPSLTPENVEDIKRVVKEQPDITIREIREKLNLPVSDETVRTKVVKLGLRYKKNDSRGGKRSKRYN